MHERFIYTAGLYQVGETVRQREENEGSVYMVWYLYDIIHLASNFGAQNHSIKKLALSCYICNKIIA